VRARLEWDEILTNSLHGRDGAVLCLNLQVSEAI